MADSRNLGVEFFRVVAAFAVVCIHTAPFSTYPGPGFLYPLTNHLTRFAVPLFFIFSGYFFGISFQRGADLRKLFWKYCGRLFWLFLAWSLFYLIVPHTGVRHLLHHDFQGLLEHLQGMNAKFQNRPWTTLFEGGEVHLWYFSALISALVLLITSLKWNRIRFFYSVAVALFIFALLTTLYSGTSLGIPFSFDPRNGPFFSSIFVAAGFWFSRQKRLPSLRTGLLLFSAGLLLQELEFLLAWKVWNRGAFHDFGLGTLGFAFGAVIIGLQVRLPQALKGIASLGQYTLGVYLLHFYMMAFAMRILSSLTVSSSLFYQFAFPVLTFGLALVSTALLLRVRPLRPLLS